MRRTWRISMPPPAPAWDSASRSSSSSWPSLASTTTICRTPSSRGLSSLMGKGQRVWGRKRPAAIPSSRSARTAPLAMRAGVLQATSSTSASWQR